VKYFTILTQDNDPFGFISILNWKHFSNVDFLIAFSHGDDGRKMEKWSDEKTIETLMERLSLFKLPKPISYHITRWNSDEFSFGSYSYVKYGSTLEDMDELKNPIENEIYFAGEATISKYHQTVHGAMMSGIEVANELKK
jgi:monoamine oxidase